MRQFSVRNTESQDFHLDDGTIRQVQMMQLYNQRFNIQKNPGSNFLQIEFNGQNIYFLKLFRKLD